MLTTAGAARSTAAAYVTRGAGCARSTAGAAGSGGRGVARIRSGRSATTRKASAKPPTTDPATNIKALPTRLSIAAAPEDPRKGDQPPCRQRSRAAGRGCSFVYNAPPPARYEIAPHALLVRAGAR